MQIVIDIPDDIGYHNTMTIEEIIMNGVVLPKGHGDLIDRSKIAFDNWSVHGHTCVIKKDIFNMPVIVPAEKESEDKEEINPYEKCKTCGQNQESCCGCPEVLELEQKKRGLRNES
jgi:hypothetical protein